MLKATGFFARYLTLMVDMNYEIQHCEHKYIAITGCARSGSTFMTEVMKAAGLDIGHHHEARVDGICSDVVASFKCLDKCIVLHQVRHPLHQIASMTTAMDKTWDYMASFMDIDNMGLLRKCMTYWLEWNARAEKKAVLTFRVENLDHYWGNICQLLSIAEQPLPDIPKDLNTRRGKYALVSWKDLFQEDTILAKRIEEKAREYGYEC